MIQSARMSAPKRCVNARYVDDGRIEIGLDEAGRGPLFGRVYAAAVALPDKGFDISRVKDSKMFHSRRKLEAAASYVRAHALAWDVSWQDEIAIDRHGISTCTMAAMHAAARGALSRVDSAARLVVDGNYFRPLTVMVEDPCAGIAFRQVEHVVVPKGDAHYASVAAASILAKCDRDAYIDQMCAAHPELIERYDIAKNKGYGAVRHLHGLQAHGPSKWHRLTFAPHRMKTRAPRDSRERGEGQSDALEIDGACL